VEAVQQTSLATLGLDLIVGSVAVGAVLAGLAGWATYTFVRRSRPQDAYSELCRRAADRYIRAGIVAWEFARGKLRGDPIYRASVCGGLLMPPARSALAEATAPSRGGGTLLDVGCGRGVALALLAEAGRAYLAGAWPAGWPSPPQFDRLIGIETRGRVASLAAAALAGDADVINADARTAAPIRANTILLFDVLHMMSLGEQESLLASMAATLEAGGVMLIREADAAAGWRFTAIKCGNRLKALVYGAWAQSFHFRTAAEWRACLVRHGFDAEIRDMSTGTPFANVLFVATRRAS
jgi:SAM-dependent methyltransferase